MPKRVRVRRLGGLDGGTGLSSCDEGTISVDVEADIGKPGQE